MYNIRLTIEYDGTNYCGWQIQKIKTQAKGTKKHKLSIQQTIESCINKIIKQKINLVAAGRTDSGVHAIGQVANFKTTSKILAHKLKSALNGILPSDIRISHSQYRPYGFHSQYSAKSKVYRYIILNQDYKSPFLQDYSYCDSVGKPSSVDYNPYHYCRNNPVNFVDPYGEFAIADDAVFILLAAVIAGAIIATQKSYPPLRRSNWTPSLKDYGINYDMDPFNPSKGPNFKPPWWAIPPMLAYLAKQFADLLKPMETENKLCCLVY